jgi:hypothetical protein
MIVMGETLDMAVARHHWPLAGAPEGYRRLTAKLKSLLHDDWSI